MTTTRFQIEQLDANGNSFVPWCSFISEAPARKFWDDWLLREGAKILRPNRLVERALGKPDDTPPIRVIAEAPPPYPQRLLEFHREEIQTTMRSTSVIALCERIDEGRLKHPLPRNLLVALMEEVGELARALLQGQDDLSVRSEALDVATLAMRIFEEYENDPALAPGAIREKGR